MAAVAVRGNCRDLDASATFDAESAELMRMRLYVVLVGVLSSFFALPLNGRNFTQLAQLVPGVTTGTGAQVNIVTKSGTRQFHGTLWAFVRNDAFQARRFFDRNSRSFPCYPSDPSISTRAACAPPFNQNQFGFNIGGPLVLIPAKSGDRTTFCGAR